MLIQKKMTRRLRRSAKRLNFPSRYRGYLAVEVGQLANLFFGTYGRKLMLWPSTYVHTYICTYVGTYMHTFISNGLHNMALMTKIQCKRNAIKPDIKKTHWIKYKGDE